MTLETINHRLESAQADHAAVMDRLGPVLMAAGILEAPRLLADLERVHARVILLMDARCEVIASGTVRKTTMEHDEL